MTSNIELKSMAKKLNITNFKGVYMREELRNLKKTLKENIILNFNTSEENSNKTGHWVAYYIDKKSKSYFDSYGSPIHPELKTYLGDRILTHDFQIQSFDGPDNTYCGLYCILFLYLMSKGCTYEDIVLSLIE